MRVKQTTGQLTLKAISGTYVVMLGMDLPKARCTGLLGFAIHRTDHTEDESYWLEGMKLFPSVVVDFQPGDKVSTRKHPIQAFTWYDLSAKPDHRYTYRVVALNGSPANPTPLETTEVTVNTETSTIPNGHEVYFNRGTAASQAYVTRFENKSPDKIGEAAFVWLSRGLHEALIGYCGRALNKDWALRVAAYEFTEPSFLKCLRKAHLRKASVKVIYHAREVDSTTIDSKGKKHTTQTGANRKAAADAAIKSLCKERLSPPKKAISHNKFIVLLHKKEPVAVLTGSTNFSMGGIFGHSNAVHVINDPAVAARYLKYWNELNKDDHKSVLGPELDGMCDVPVPPVPAANPPKGTTAVFSPRSGTEALDYYAALAGRAEGGLFMTFAFGMNPLFQDIYEKGKAALRFAVMEKAVLPRKDKVKQAAEEKRIIELRKMPENRFAIGGLIALNALEHWAAEKLSGQNVHVKFLHTKYMLVDPLGEDPVVVAGSANFSNASCDENDENMLVVRGDTRVADIYLGEFMRLYKHFAFRDWVRWAIDSGKLKQGEVPSPEYLDETDKWWRKWFGNTPQSHERQYFTK